MELTLNMEPFDLRTMAERFDAVANHASLWSTRTGRILLQETGNVEEKFKQVVRGTESSARGSSI